MVNYLSDLVISGGLLYFLWLFHQLISNTISVYSTKEKYIALYDLKKLEGELKQRNLSFYELDSFGKQFVIKDKEKLNRIQTIDDKYDSEKEDSILVVKKGKCFFLQQLLFLIFFLGSFGLLFLMLREKESLFFGLLSMGFNLGLAGGLATSGIDFLTQVDSNGFFIYTAATVANNPFVAGLSALFVGLGFLSLFWVFKVLGDNDWQIKII